MLQDKPDEGRNKQALIAYISESRDREGNTFYEAAICDNVKDEIVKELSDYDREQLEKEVVPPAAYPCRITSNSSTFVLLSIPEVCHPGLLQVGQIRSSKWARLDARTQFERLVSHLMSGRTCDCCSYEFRRRIFPNDWIEDQFNLARRRFDWLLKKHPKLMKIEGDKIYDWCVRTGRDDCEWWWRSMVAAYLPHYGGGTKVTGPEAKRPQTPRFG